MEPAAFNRALSQGSVAPLYLFASPERLLLSDAIGRLGRVLFPDPEQAVLNRETFSGENAAAEALIRSAQSLPFLALHRLVIVWDAEKFRAEEVKRMLPYFADPNPYTCLVFAALAADPKSPLTKALPRDAVVDFKPPVGRGVVAWLREHAKGEGIDLSEEAARLLVELAGEDLTLLRNELAKAALFSQGDRKQLDSTDIEAVVGESRARSIWDLLRALESREGKRAVAVLDRLIRAGEDPLGLLAMIGRHYRLLWQAKAMLERGMSRQEIGQRLRRNPAYIETFLGQAQASTTEELRGIFRRLLQVEWELKSGAPSPQLSLEELVVELCGVA